MIPQNIADEIWASMRQGASSRSASNPPLFYEEASTHASSMGGSGSGEASMSGSASAKRQRDESHGHARQIPLSQVPGNVGGSVAFLRERQKIADIEIARTIIECNLSFNVLNNEQRKKMVRAIANVGPCEGWSGVSYKDMRTTKIDEEKKRIDQALTPIRAAWAKYGCSILSDGWRDRKKRGIINILVSCPLGAYFLRAVDTGKKGKATTGAFIYHHIRQAILEVNC